jgi:DNA-binding winged helix-turn-helix (wHTH) protein
LQVLSRKAAVVRLRFGPFILNSDTRQLTRDDRDVHLTAKAFELLLTLASHRPQALSKSVLQETLWPETFVAEANLSNLVAEIRQALGDKARRSTWIRTVHGFGYAFCGPAVGVPAGEPPTDRPTCWIEWGSRRFPLFIGEHVIGRDPDVAVRLDLATVSRRHARLVVTEHGTTLEDFGSKNGTRRGGDRLVAPVSLTDGDEIQIGSLRLTFRLRPLVKTTETQAEASR